MIWTRSAYLHTGPRHAKRRTRGLKSLTKTPLKGLDTFAIVDPQTVAYQDFSGSGAETIAHLKQNGRITIMFCAFEGPPFILRLYGQGEVLELGNPNFDELNERFAFDLGVRSIIRVRLTRIQDSCGYGVPLYDFVKPRDTLLKWAERKGEQGTVEFKHVYNARSIDGLLALEVFDRPQ